MKDKNTIQISRVSTDDQNRSASPDAQKAWLAWIEQKEDLNVVKRIYESISGKIFPKKYFDEFIDLTQEFGIDYICVHQIDRLSRNLAYGSMLLERMHEVHKLNIITSTAKYDYDVSSHQTQVKTLLLFAEQEQGARFENVVRSMDYLLKNGWYPLSPPFGYEKDKNNIYKKKRDRDNTLHQTAWCAEVMNYLCDTFECTKNFVRTAHTTMERFKELDLQLTGPKVKNILQNKTYIGYLNWAGGTYGYGENNVPWNDLKVISEEKYNRIQSIIREIEQHYNRENDLILEELVDEYGIEPVMEVLPLKIACRICGSTDKKKNGTDENGQKKYFCKKCGNEYRFPLTRDIKKIEKLVAQPCPKCGTTNQFALINDGSTLWQLRCKSCGFVTFLHQYNDDHRVQKIQDVKKEKNGKKIIRDSAQKSLVIFEDHVHDDMKDGMIVS